MVSESQFSSQYPKEESKDFISRLVSNATGIQRLKNTMRMFGVSRGLEMYDEHVMKNRLNALEVKNNLQGLLEAASSKLNVPLQRV